MPSWSKWWLSLALYSTPGWYWDMRGRNISSRLTLRLWYRNVRYTPRDRLRRLELAQLTTRHARVASSSRSVQVVLSLRPILVYRMRLPQDSTTKMFNMHLAFLTFHQEMTETKRRFLLRVTLPRHQRRIALAEEQALIYLGT